MNTNQLGSLGEAKAIAYFIANGYDVFTQFPGKAPFDLVVYRENKLFRVSVKTTKHKMCPLRQSTRKGNKPFDRTSCDLLVVYNYVSDKLTVLDASKIDKVNAITVG